MFGPPREPGDDLPRLGQGEEYELKASDDVRLYDLEHDAKIIDWRVESFLALGFDVLNAAVLAVRRDIDREEVERLIKAGGSPETVTLILV